MLQLLFLVVLLFGLLVAIVAVQNTTPVTLRVLTFELPNVALSVLVLVSVAVGAFITLLLGLGSWIGNARALRQRNQTIARLEAQLARERAAPPPAAIAEPPPPGPWLSESTESRVGTRPHLEEGPAPPP